MRQAATITYGKTWEPKSESRVTPDDIISEAHASFATAKNTKDIESVKEWCRDNLAVFSFKERDQLMVSALSLLGDNKLEEANTAIKRVNQLEELDKNLADMSCKPDSMDEVLRRARTTRQK